MKKRTVAVLLALTLVVGGVIGGTVAYLTTSTNQVVNTFTVGDINITLTETKGPDGKELAEGQAWSAKLTPGAPYTKNPAVGVTAGSEACWLFVKVDEGASAYLDYTLNLKSAPWTAYTKDSKDNPVFNVYYIPVDAATAMEGATWELLKDNKVTVKDSIVKGAAGENEVTMPAKGTTIEMTFQAAAVQSDNVTLDEAYDLISGKFA